MIKRFLLAFTLLASTFTLAQQVIIDKLNLDENTILVGMASDYNTDKTFDKYNFIIDNPSKLKDIKLNFEHGYELDNKVTDENHFMIYAIKDRKIVDQWLINPKLYNVFYNGVAYSFDADKLEEIATKYPLNVSLETKLFKNEKEFKKVKKELDKDDSIIIMYEPNFTFEGTFEISLPKDDTITSAEKAEEYIRNLAKPFTKKELSVVYALNEKNLIDRSQFTIVVSSPKVVYDKLNVEKGEKSEWTPTVYDAFIVKKN